MKKIIIERTISSCVECPYSGVDVCSKTGLKLAKRMKSGVILPLVECPLEDVD